MLTVFIRTVIIYFLLVVLMRIMGKRQLGELELSELIVTFMLSEIATVPITDSEKPIISILIPIITLAALEIFSSLIMLKIPAVKRLMTSAPSVVISKGVINIKAMRRSRISIDELMCQIRQNGVFDISEVDYAILEENGRMSIIPKAIYRQPDMHDLNLKCRDRGVMHIIISDRRPNDYGLALTGHDREWLDSTMSQLGIKIKDIFCMTVDDCGKIFIQKTDGIQIIK